MCFVCLDSSPTLPLDCNMHLCRRYKAAYISISLPAAIAPLVMLDALTLPWVEEQLDISQRPWYAPLMEYSTDDAAGNDAEGDGSLLPKVVLTYLLPWLRSGIEHLYQPMSASHTCNVASLLEKILDLDPTPSQLAPLLTTILEAFRLTISDTCLPVPRGKSGLALALVHRSIRTLSDTLRNLADLAPYFAARVVAKIAWEVVNRSQGAVVKLLTLGVSHECLSAVKELYLRAVRVISLATPTEMQSIGVGFVTVEQLKSIVKEDITISLDIFRDTLLQFLRRLQ